MIQTINFLSSFLDEWEFRGLPREGKEMMNSVGGKRDKVVIAEEKRNRLPTIAQQRSIMCTYLKNMEGWKHNSLKNKSFANIQEFFDKEMKRVNTFVNYKTELVEESSKKAEAELMEGSSKRAGTELKQESSKRAGTELEQESYKKQKIDDDKKI
nr:hypothetical protein [Tanacetum cinerariifolium]